jgi:hypothetical protein
MCENEVVIFQNLLEAVKEYTVNVSIIEWAGVSAILFRIQKNGKGLADEELVDVIERLKAQCVEQ